MNWRDKWQCKTRGGFEVLDVRDHPRNDARLLVAMWVGTGHEVLQYERAMNGQYYRTEYSDFDLLPITPPAEQQGDKPDEESAVASLAVLVYQGWKRCSDAFYGNFSGHYSKSLVTADGEFELSFGRKNKPAFAFVETAETLAERDDDDDCYYCGGPMDETDGQACSKCIATVLADATESEPSSPVELPADLDVSGIDQPDLADIRRDAESKSDFA